MNTNGIQVDMVDMSEAVNDPNAEVWGEGEASVDAIPDIGALTDTILEIIEYLDRPEIVRLRKEDSSVVRIALINKYADSVPLNFIDLFMEEDSEHRAESIERTLKLFEKLAQVKAGTLDLETMSQEFSEEVKRRYVYSEYGGKEQFEAALRKELSKDQRSKGRAAGF